MADAPDRKCFKEQTLIDSNSCQINYKGIVQQINNKLVFRKLNRDKSLVRQSINSIKSPIISKWIKIESIVVEDKHQFTIMYIEWWFLEGKCMKNKPKDYYLKQTKTKYMLSGLRWNHYEGGGSARNWNASQKRALRMNN